MKKLNIKSSNVMLLESLSEKYFTDLLSGSFGYR